MKCPFCNTPDAQVKDSRPSEDATAIRRRRFCVSCKKRFTTFERVQLRELIVIKRDGRRSPFDRDKLMRSLQVALRKRMIATERIEKLVAEIILALETKGDSEVSSKLIGQYVMDGLAKLDTVAYVRFASVYKDFREADDFGYFVKKLHK